MIMLSWITKIKLRTNGIWGHVRYRVTTKQIIPTFTRIFKGIQGQFDLKIDSAKGGVLQMHFINLIKEAYEEAAHHGLR
jgi:hypothetical protein